MHLCQLLTLLPNGKGMTGLLSYGYERNMMGFLFPPRIKQICLKMHRSPEENNQQLSLSKPSK